MPFLEPKEFLLMEKYGLINPCRLRFAQGEANVNFFNSERTIYDLATALQKQPGYASNLQELEIGEFSGRIWSFDTRRLIALQMAYVHCNTILAKYKKLGASEVLERLANFEPQPQQGIYVAIRNSGVNGSRTIHVNPEYNCEHFTQKGLADALSRSTPIVTPVEFASEKRLLQIISSGEQVICYPPK